jgi:glycolate oxidase iron-sulfur subunit
VQRWLAALARGPLGRVAAMIGPTWLGRLRTLAALAPRAPEPQCEPAPQRSRGAITLFAGCLGHLIDTDTLNAAHRLLHRLGYEVTSAPPELCCGTWSHHAGNLGAAEADATQCRAMLTTASPTPVVHLASGCDAGLRAALAETRPVWEICAFLAEHAPIESVSWSAPTELHVALMVPCSQSSATPILSLLSKVPRIKVSVLPQQPRCCGAAGMQFVDHAALSDRLRDEKLAQIDALQADLVLSNNHACRMHLRAGLQTRGRTIAVMHPVAFLETLCT